MLVTPARADWSKIRTMYAASGTPSHYWQVSPYRDASITKGKPTGKVKEFLDWLTSDEGQKIVESVGTVSLKQGKSLKAKFKHWENTDRIVNYNSI